MSCLTFHLATSDPSRIEVERAPHSQKFVLEVTARAQNALALGAHDDGELLRILRSVHEDRSTGHAFQLAAEVFVWHPTLPTCNHTPVAVGRELV